MAPKKDDTQAPATRLAFFKRESTKDVSESAVQDAAFTTSIAKRKSPSEPDPLPAKIAAPQSATAARTPTIKQPGAKATAKAKSTCEPFVFFRAAEVGLKQKPIFATSTTNRPKTQQKTQKTTPSEKAVFHI